MPYGYGAPGTIVLGPGGHEAVPGVPMKQPEALFRFGEQSIWSEQFFPGASVVANSTNRLFSTPLGQVGQGFTVALSIAETNLKEGGRVPQGVAYDVFGIATQILHATNATDAPAAFNAPADTTVEIADILNVLNNGVLSWDFTQTQVDIAPCMLIGKGSGAFGAVATTQNAVDRGQIGRASCRERV